jgi:hypothetical protein
MSIPKIIYQSWKKKELPAEMQKVSNRVRDMNPNYEYQFFDDNDCREYLLNNFGVNYANAFDSLIPGAFKCDFWRYAILYKEGGVYIDLDMTPVVPLDSILRENDEFVSVVDRTMHGMVGIYQAFIACKPGHPILKHCLDISFANIVTKRGNNFFYSLCITGPCVAGVAFNLFWNRRNTNKKIAPGDYGKGIRLFQNNNSVNITDNDDNLLFLNKYDGYERGSYSSIGQNYYHKNPQYKAIKYTLYFVCVLIVLFLLGMICSIVFRKKWKECINSIAESEQGSFRS